MNASDATTALVAATVDLGSAALAVLGSVLGLGVAYFVFRWGWVQVRASLASDAAVGLLRWRRGLYAQNARLSGQAENDELRSLGVKVQTSTYFSDRH